MANQKTALMLHRQFFVYFSVIQLIVSVSYFEILRFLSVTEIYINMSEILIIWLSALVSQMAPYLIFILLQKSTHSVIMVLYSQNARLCRNRALTICIIDQTSNHAGRTKSFTTARKRILRLLELQSLVAKCCKIRKI